MKYCKKERFLLLLSMMFMACLGLTSCFYYQDDEPVSGGGSYEEVKNYVERLYPVVDPKNNSQGTVLLRFYKDMPNVAYISVSRFQEMMYPGTTVQVQSLGDGQYMLTSPCGTAKVDTKKDLFTSNDYEAFTNMMGIFPISMWTPICIWPTSTDRR